MDAEKHTNSRKDKKLSKKTIIIVSVAAALALLITVPRILSIVKTFEGSKCIRDPYDIKCINCPGGFCGDEEYAGSGMDSDQSAGSNEPTYDYFNDDDYIMTSFNGGYVKSWRAKSLKDLGGTKRGIAHPGFAIVDSTETAARIDEIGSPEDTLIIPIWLTVHPDDSKAAASVYWSGRINDDISAVQVYEFNVSRGKYSIVNSSIHSYIDNKTIQACGYIKITPSEFIRNYNDEIEVNINGTIVELLKDADGFVFEERKAGKEYLPLYK
jgi:hypothetical protein